MSAAPGGLPPISATVNPTALSSAQSARDIIIYPLNYGDMARNSADLAPFNSGGVDYNLLVSTVATGQRSGPFASSNDAIIPLAILGLVAFAVFMFARRTK